MRDKFTHRTLVVFNRLNSELSDLLDSGKLHSGNALEFVSLMNSDEFDALELPKRITWYMMGSSLRYVLPTEAVAHDAESPVLSVQEKVIRALRKDAHLPAWDRRTLVERAFDLDTISVPALAFLLNLYAWYLYPVYGDEDDRIAFVCHDLGFGLADFCRE